MILVTIRMKAPSEKRLELSQTISSLISSIRTEKGCKRCDLYQDIVDENKFCLLEQWDTREDLKSHLRSKRFGVLRGAMHLLKEPCEMLFLNAFHPAGIEEICG
jgi:quinol monooxygenase YgiN